MLEKLEIIKFQKTSKHRCRTSWLSLYWLICPSWLAERFNPIASYALASISAQNHPRERFFDSRCHGGSL